MNSGAESSISGFERQAWRYVHIVPAQSIFDMPMSDGRQLQIYCAFPFHEATNCRMVTSTLRVEY